MDTIIKLLPAALGVLGTLFLILDSGAKLGKYGVLGISLIYWGFTAYAAEVCYEAESEPLIGVIAAAAVLVVGLIPYVLAMRLIRRKGA